jgi:hypothetical protein
MSGDISGGNAMELVQQRWTATPLFTRASGRRLRVTLLLLGFVIAAAFVWVITQSSSPSAGIAGGVGSPAWLAYRAGERAVDWNVVPATVGSLAWLAYRADERAVDGH